MRCSSAHRVIVILAGLTAGAGATVFAGDAADTAVSGVETLAARIAMVVPRATAVPNWPRWRGPSGQGLVADTGYPDTWSKIDNVLWRIPVPGIGNSSPIIWGDKIFVTTSYEAGRRRSIRVDRRLH